VRSRRETWTKKAILWGSDPNLRCASPTTSSRAYGTVGVQTDSNEQEGRRGRNVLTGYGSLRRAMAAVTVPRSIAEGKL